MLVPDYGNYTDIAIDGSNHNTLQYLGIHAGNYISQYYPSGHFWMYKTNYTDSSIAINNSKRDMNLSLSYTIPSSGYLYINFVNEAWAFKDIMTQTEPHNGYSLRVDIYRNGNYVNVFAKTEALATNINTSTLIPVAKGDMIYYGTWYDYSALPSGYTIRFYSAKSVDAKTGD